MAATPDPLADLRIGVGLPTLGERGMPGTFDAAGAARHVEAIGDGRWAMGDGTPTLEVTVCRRGRRRGHERVGIGFGVLAPPLRPVA